MALNKEQKLAAYKSMLRIREFEDALPRMQEEGIYQSEPHQYIGEEAVAVGVSSVLTITDTFTSTHRGHGHLLAKGGEMKYMYAELCGKATGYCKGKGGTMHVTSKELGSFGANGMVGQGVCMALGAAFANKYEKTTDIAVAYFGDGAANEGTIHESMNLASVLKLPVLFVCENNGYAISTSADEACSVKDIAVRAAGYNMPGVVVDGMDVEAVHEAAAKAVEYIRAGNGPYFIEAKTYRFFDHYFGMYKVNKYQYRTEEEVEEWRAKDPIPKLKNAMLADGSATEEEFIAIEKEVEAEVNEGIKFAAESPYPDISEAYTDMYADEHYTMPIRGW